MATAAKRRAPHARARANASETPAARGMQQNFQQQRLAIVKFTMLAGLPLHAPDRDVRLRKNESAATHRATALSKPGKLV
ncbi:MAG TPA: hypothetical protein VGN31_19360 [Paraburkholderia sp.]|jgi:hypothetical protein